MKKLSACALTGTGSIVCFLQKAVFLFFLVFIIDNSQVDSIDDMIPQPIGGCVKSRSDGPVPADIWSTTAVIYDEKKYPPFKKHVVTRGIILAAIGEIDDTFLERVTITLNQMIPDDENNNALNRSNQEDMMIAMARKRTLIPIVKEDFWNKFSNNERAQYNFLSRTYSMTCDVIFEGSIEDLKGQPMEVIEHLLHFINQAGLHYLKFDEWGISRDSTLYEQLEISCKKDFFNYDGCDSFGNNSDGADRILLQEYSYWLIATWMDLVEPYGPNGVENEWALYNPSLLNEKQPDVYNLVVDEIPELLAVPTNLDDYFQVDSIILDPAVIGSYNCKAGVSSNWENEYYKIGRDIGQIVHEHNNNKQKNKCEQSISEAECLEFSLKFSEAECLELCKSFQVTVYSYWVIDNDHFKCICYTKEQYDNTNIYPVPWTNGKTCLIESLDPLYNPTLNPTIKPTIKPTFELIVGSYNCKAGVSSNWENEYYKIGRDIGQIVHEDHNNNKLQSEAECMELCNSFQVTVYSYWVYDDVDETKCVCYTKEQYDNININPVSWTNGKTCLIESLDPFNNPTFKPTMKPTIKSTPKLKPTDSPNESCGPDDLTFFKKNKKGKKFNCKWVKSARGKKKKRKRCKTKAKKKKRFWYYCPATCAKVNAGPCRN